MGQRHRGSIGLLLTIAIAVNGCAAATARVGESGMAQLRKHQHVVAVHYEQAPRFLLGQPRSVGRAMALGAALAPFALLFGAPAISLMGNALQADIEKRQAEAAGQRLMMEIPLEDPVVRVKERLISALSAEGGIGRIRPATTPMGSEDLKSLKQTLGPVTVLDVRTTSWGLHPYRIEDPRTFVTYYTVKVRLIRLDQEEVLWRDEISCSTAGDRRFGVPTLEDLRADGGALLKNTMAKTAEGCVGPLLASFRGNKATRPVRRPDEPAKVTFDPGTLERAEDALFGPSGLVDGPRRFEAKFQGLTLTAQDLPRLRAMLQRSAPSPWRSEVQFRGMLDGAAFEAEMDKDSSGRIKFTFDGLRFTDEEQASAFVAPLQGRGVREVKLLGVAGGAPIEIVLSPSSSSPAPPRVTAVAHAAPATSAVPSAAATPLAEPEPELKRLVGMWTGTFTGPPRSASDLGIRHDVTLRIFEQGGVIRWEASRRSSGREVSRSSGTVALSQDGIVLSGQRRASGSSTSARVAVPLTRQGRTLEGSILGRDNVVYTISLTRIR